MGAMGQDGTGPSWFFDSKVKDLHGGLEGYISGEGL